MVPIGLWVSSLLQLKLEASFYNTIQFSLLFMAISGSYYAFFEHFRKPLASLYQSLAECPSRWWPRLTSSSRLVSSSTFVTTYQAFISTRQESTQRAEDNSASSWIVWGRTVIPVIFIQTLLSARIETYELSQRIQRPQMDYWFTDILLRILVLASWDLLLGILGDVWRFLLRPVDNTNVTFSLDFFPYTICFDKYQAYNYEYETMAETTRVAVTCHYVILDLVWRIDFDKFQRLGKQRGTVVDAITLTLLID